MFGQNQLSYQLPLSIFQRDSLFFKNPYISYDSYFAYCCKYSNNQASYPGFCHPYYYNPYFADLAANYLNDDLAQHLPYWNSSRPVFILAPTGSGKSFFVKETLIPFATEKKENVLILTNRKTLCIAYRKDVAESKGEAGYYTDTGFQELSTYGKNVSIVSYQGLGAFLKENKERKFSYVIFDECHYYLQDALFSDSTDIAFKMIHKHFRKAVRIYISATMEEVLPCILEGEWNNFNTNHVKISRFQGNVLHNMFSPLFYDKKRDFSRIHLCFFKDLKYAISHTPEKDKYIVFCKTIAMTKEIKDSFEDVLAIDAKFLSKHKDIQMGLIESASFTQKCLATTSVYANGNNIIDPKVKHIFISHLDLIDIFQMAGRRRLNGDEDSFTLYLFAPSSNYLDKEIKNIRKKYELVLQCEKDISLINRIILDKKGHNHKFIHNICRFNSITENYEINGFCKIKLQNYLAYLEYIRNLNKPNRVEAYCSFIAGLFGKTFDSSMLIGTEADKYEDIKQFILEKFGLTGEKTTSNSLTETEFLEFSKELFEKRKELGLLTKQDNTGKNRKSMQESAINNRIENLGLIIKKNNNEYTLEFIQKEDPAHENQSDS